MSKTTDLVTLVDEQDRVVGELDKYEAHRYPTRLHRAISVYLFRKAAGGEVEVLVQQRSGQKIVGAGQWANTCCGNVWPGESYLECAKRRLTFELGITTATIQDIVTFRYEVKCNDEFGENEIDHVFAGWYDGPVVPNPEEVSNSKWVPWSQFRGAALTAVTPMAPWFELMLRTTSVTEALDAFIQV